MNQISILIYTLNDENCQSIGQYVPDNYTILYEYQGTLQPEECVTNLEQYNILQIALLTRDYDDINDFNTVTLAAELLGYFNLDFPINCAAVVSGEFVDLLNLNMLHLQDPQLRESTDPYLTNNDAYHGIIQSSGHILKKSINMLQDCPHMSQLIQFAQTLPSEPTGERDSGDYPEYFNEYY